MLESHMNNEIGINDYRVTALMKMSALIKQTGIIIHIHVT